MVVRQNGRSAVRDDAISDDSDSGDSDRGDIDGADPFLGDLENDNPDSEEPVSDSMEE